MTQQEAYTTFNLYKDFVEKQKNEQIEIAKQEANRLQEQYREQLNQERHLINQAELAEKIKAAQEYRDNRIDNIEQDASSRIAAAEALLKENVEKALQMETKLNEEKARQDAELRQKDLQREEFQKQRDELDKQQERERQTVMQEQAKLDEQIKQQLQKDLQEKQHEIERQRMELERQREIERERELERQREYERQNR